jgi:hypothetical protein
MGFNGRMAANKIRITRPLMNFKEWLLSEVGGGVRRTKLSADTVSDTSTAYGIPFGGDRTPGAVQMVAGGLAGGIGLGARRAYERSGGVTRATPQTADIPLLPNKKVSDGISLPLQLPALARRPEDNNSPLYMITSTSWNAVNNLTYDPENEPKVRKVGEAFRDGDKKFIPPASGNQYELNFAISFTKTLIHIMTVQKMNDIDPEGLKKYDFVNAHTEVERVDKNNVLTCVFSFKKRDNVPDGIKKQNYEQN